MRGPVRPNGGFDVAEHFLELDRFGHEWNPTAQSAARRDLLLFYGRSQENDWKVDRFLIY